MSLESLAIAANGTAVQVVDEKLLQRSIDALPKSTYRYTVNDLPQMEHELRTLKERVHTATERATAYDAAVRDLTNKISVGRSAREKLIDVTTKHALPGYSDKVYQLTREIERCDDALRSALTERDRHQKVAEASQKLINEWPMRDAYAELKEVQRSLNAVDDRLAAPSL
jgi:predicted  nucleic acid-binding Zn-ribbon protein